MSVAARGAIFGRRKLPDGLLEELSKGREKE
jgi:hypothetical protein